MQLVRSRREGGVSLRVCAPRMRAAFTLSELMVVVGIISALLGILLPAVGQARQAARGVKCLSNLRQMAITCHMYLERNDGTFPVAQYERIVGDKRIKYAWDFTTVLDKNSGAVIEIRPGMLWGRVDASEIHQCPSYDGASNTLADPYTGYNYNTSYLGHGMGEDDREQPANIAEVKRQDRCALFGDGGYRDGANKFMRSPLRTLDDKFKWRWAGTQAFRHNGRTNVVFVDGHAVTISERHVTMDPASQAFNIVEGTGFLSEDNSLYDFE